MERSLEKLNYKEFKKLVPSQIGLVILPIGTIEAHGAIPLGTDNIIPFNIAYEIAEELNAIVAPTVPYGITHSLLPYPGSLTVSTPSFKSYVLDILLSLAKAGFNNILILNGHGGNTRTLRDLQLEVWEKTELKSIMIEWWDFASGVTEEVYGESGGHAGVDETAMVMAVDPALVHPDLYDANDAYVIRNGAYVYPNGGTILISKKGEGLPIFDEKRAKIYWDKVRDEIISFVKGILGKWQKE